jgi:hypothetical protein
MSASQGTFRWVSLALAGVLVLGVALLAEGCAKKSESAAARPGFAVPSAGGQSRAAEAKPTTTTAPPMMKAAAPGARTDAAKAAAPTSEGIATSQGTTTGSVDLSSAKQIAQDSKAPEIKEKAPASESEPEKLEGKLIRNAQVAVEVTDVGAAVKRVRDTVTEYGGYVGDSDIQHAEGSATRATLTVKLPSKRYEDFMALLQESDFGRLLTAKETTEDVTEEWIDVDARIRTLTEQREELRKQLNRAPDLNTYAQLQREIQTVQQQIEQSQGRLNYLKSKVTYSTIQLELMLHQDQSQLLRQEREVGKWTASETWQRASGSATRGLQAVASVAMWLLAFIWCWGPIVLALCLLIRRASREVRKAEQERQARLKQAEQAYRTASPGDGATEQSAAPPEGTDQGS